MSAKKMKSRFLRILKVFVVLAVVLGVVGYAMRARIIAKVLALAEIRLEEYGFHISHESQELVWNRGVVLKGLALYVDEGKKTRLAEFENVGVRIPILEFFQDDAKLIFSSDHGYLKIETSAGGLQLDDLDFKLMATRELIEFAHFEASSNGLRLTVEGGLPWGTEGAKRMQEVEMPDLAPVVKAASWLKFSGGDPTLALRVDPADGGAKGVELSGQLSGGAFRWRGMAVDRAKIRIGLSEGRVEMPEFRLDCYGGTVAGALVIDYQGSKLEVHKVGCSADPFAFVDAMMEREWLKRFRSPGSVKMSGEALVFDLRNFSESTGTLVVDAPGGIVIPIDSMEIPLTGFQGEVKFGAGKLDVEAKSFSLHGGHGSGSYVMPLSGGFHYQLKVAVDGMSLKQTGRAFGVEKDLSGTMRVDFQGGGGSGIKSHFGKGGVKVSDGSFYAVPLLGSFRALLKEKSPRFWVDEARDLSASFSLKDATGVVKDTAEGVKDAAEVAEGDLKKGGEAVDKIFDRDLLRHKKKTEGK